MKRNDRKAPPRLQQSLSRSEATRELTKLVIHVNAQRLKCPRGRMPAVVVPADNACTNFGEIGCAYQRRFLARVYDRACDRTCLALFTERPNDLIEFAFT